VCYFESSYNREFWLHVVNSNFTICRILMRLGIFGGSFDPVHNGHLALARACQRHGALDEVWFTPTAVQPLKQLGPQASDAARVEMLLLAIRSETSWRVCRLEIERGGFSYTVDTLREIALQRPDAVLFFLMGADAVKDAPDWREPGEIFRLATPLIVHRVGESEPDLAALQAVSGATHLPKLIEMPAVAASSTEIRRRAAAGESLDDLVPAAVARFIENNRLYATEQGVNEFGRLGDA
jgi:nicotinate-nucleotide adenylyltransferase